MDWLTLGGAAGLFVIGGFNAINGHRNQRTSKQVKVAVGQNSVPLADLVHKIGEQTDYLHARNHDVIRNQMRVEAAMILSLSGVEAPTVKEAQEAVGRLAEELRLQYFPEIPAKGHDR